MVAAWPFYLIGTIVVLVAFATLNRWIKGIAGLRGDAPGHGLAAAAVAFLIGSATIAVGIVFDSDQIRLENTRTFVYRVVVEIDGAVSVRLLLPAPLDARLHADLNRTNGTARLTLTENAGGLSVEVVASANVSFEIRHSLVGEPLNRTMSRMSPATPPEQSGVGSATIDLETSGAGMASVRVDLDVEFLEFCFTTRHGLDAAIQLGASTYPVTSTVTFC
jgi:hypothetical protein